MYQELATPGWVKNLETGWEIPPDESNGMYLEYLAWVEAGNTPLPMAKEKVDVSMSEIDERLTLIQARAAEDPAYAALARHLGVI